MSSMPSTASRRTSARRSKTSRRDRDGVVRRELLGERRPRGHFVTEPGGSRPGEQDSARLRHGERLESGAPAGCVEKAREGGERVGRPVAAAFREIRVCRGQHGRALPA